MELERHQPKKTSSSKTSTLLNNNNEYTNGGAHKSTPAIKSDSKHFTSLQIFTNYAEPALDEYLTQKDQVELENKHRNEEDKLYRLEVEKDI